MEKDNFELATGPEAETGHCERTAQMVTETTAVPPRELHGGYAVREPLQKPSPSDRDIMSRGVGCRV